MNKALHIEENQVFDVCSNLANPPILGLRSSIVAFVATLVLPLCLQAATGVANDDDEIFNDYESIVRELSNDSSRQEKVASQIRSRRSYAPVSDPFSKVLFHGGLAYAYTFQTLQPEGRNQTFVAQSGMRASLGIDLLSDSLLAEGGFATFPEVEYYHAFIAAREFDLKIAYRASLAPKVETRFGAGLIARYLTYTAKQHIGQGEMATYNRLDSETFVTPSSNFTAGLYIHLTPSVSTGFELEARRAFIADTIDRSSFDSSFRVDANF